MPLSLFHGLIDTLSSLPPLQRARRAAAVPAARAAHVARKNLEPCAAAAAGCRTADASSCAASSCAGGASASLSDAQPVYVALRVHDTKITLLRVRAPAPRPPPAPAVTPSSILQPVAADTSTPPADACGGDADADLQQHHTLPQRHNTPRPLRPARERALRQRLTSAD